MSAAAHLRVIPGPYSETGLAVEREPRRRRKGITDGASWVRDAKGPIPALGRFCWRT